MDTDQIAALFTRADGTYLCARWGRPIVPVVFGVDDATLGVFKGAIEAVVTLAQHQMAETDPELGANLMVFFCRDWDELTDVPHLEKLLPDLGPLVARLKDADANQYRIFRFDDAGAIRAAFVFLRMDENLSQVSAVNDQTVLRPDISAVIRAAYDPVMPAVAQDASHALRLSARIGAVQ